MSVLSQQQTSVLSQQQTSVLSHQKTSILSQQNIKAWLAEAATVANQSNDRESLACGGRDSGRPKSLHGASDDPRLTAKKIDTAT